MQYNIMVLSAADCSAVLSANGLVKDKMILYQMRCEFSSFGRGRWLCVQSSQSDDES
jgi:hypothetical protein